MTAIVCNGNEIFLDLQKDAQNVYSFQWHPGMENLADYQSKHHPGAHHTTVQSYYLHKENSPRELPRANQPSTLKGCVIPGYLHVPSWIPTLPKLGSILGFSQRLL